MNKKKTSILLTIDVEDWFQVENFKQYIPFSTWPERELRVERNTQRLLDLFDSVEVEGEQEDRKEYIENRKQEKAKGSIQNKASGFQHQEPNNKHTLANEIHNNDNKAHFIGQTTNNKPIKKVQGTFFILGWIAERLPNLVREIHSRGHEVASHGYCHDLCTECTLDALTQDLIDSKKILEDIIGNQVFGYRAPSFSIDNDVLKIIEDAGYQYDSSYNSFGLHGRYGKLDLRQKLKKGIVYNISNDFYEIPVSNLKIGFPFGFQPSALSSNIVFPWSGGGYFRLLPYWIFKNGVKYILSKNEGYIFYLHPWEIDPGQPKMTGIKTGYKIRHYLNLNKTCSRLLKLLDDFNQCNFIGCHEFIEQSLAIKNT